MTPRSFAALCGALTIIAALVFMLAVPITLTDSNGTPLACGTAVQRDEEAAKQYGMESLRRQLESTLDVTTGRPTGDGVGTPAGGYTPVAAPDCEGAQTQRLTWTIPLAIVGAVVVAGALVVRRPS